MASWSKLYHALPRSPAILAAVAQAGPGALGLHLEALAWCGEYLTDGRMTSGQVGRFICYTPDAVQALINAGVWLQDGEGLTLAGYLDGPGRQESAADVRQRREDWTREKRHARRAAAAQQQRLARPGAPERPAGPSDHVAPGPPCGVDWCDGRFHYSHDPDDNTPRAQRSSYPCRLGPLASKRRSA